MKNVLTIKAMFCADGTVIAACPERGEVSICCDGIISALENLGKMMKNNMEIERRKATDK